MSQKVEGDIIPSESCAVIDPDYAPFNNADIQNAETAASANDLQAQRRLENKLQVKKITGIISDEITTEINGLENDIYVIDQRLNQTRLVLDRLRAAMLISYYDRAKGKTTQTSGSGSQPGIHPTIKAEIGKSVPSEKKMQFASLNPQAADTGSEQAIALVEKAKARSKMAASNSNQSVAARHRVVVGNVSKYISAQYRQKNDQVSYTCRCQTNVTNVFNIVIGHCCCRSLSFVILVVLLCIES